MLMPYRTGSTAGSFFFLLQCDFHFILTISPLAAFGCFWKSVYTRFKILHTNSPHRTTAYSRTRQSYVTPFCGLHVATVCVRACVCVRARVCVFPRDRKEAHAFCSRVGRQPRRKGKLFALYSVRPRRETPNRLEKEKVFLKKRKKRSNQWSREKKQAKGKMLVGIAFHGSSRVPRNFSMLSRCTRGRLMTHVW